jgi:hypothetical protein
MERRETEVDDAAVTRACKASERMSGASERGSREEERVPACVPITARAMRNGGLES